MTWNDGLSGDAETDEVIRREQMLLDASVRSSVERIATLLHGDFAEVGATGQTWDATGALVAMSGDAAEGEVAHAFDLTAVRLAEDVVLVTYETRRSGRVIMRSSIWVRVGTEWKLRYHQGTPANPAH